MITHRIRFIGLTGRRETFETTSKRAAARRLAEARKTDPRARLLSIPERR